MRADLRSLPARNRSRPRRAATACLLLVALGPAGPGASVATGQGGPGAEAGQVPEGLNFANGLFQARRFDLAVQEYRRFLDAAPPDSPHRAEALFGQANAHHFLQEYTEARRAFEAFLQAAPADHPNAPTALFRVGELAYVLGDLPAARKALEAYTSGPPAHRYQDLAWPYLGDVRFREGDLDGARAAYERALASFPDGRMAGRARLYLGRVLARQGDHAGALARLRELAARPDAAGRDEALDLVGRLELEAGAPDRALEAFEALGRDLPQSPLAARARLGQAEALAALGRPDEAAELLSDLRDDPSPELAARASYLLGMQQLDRGDVAEALATFDEAIGRYPATSTAPALLYRSAEASERAGDPADAMARFERLADAYPDDSWADDALLQAASIALEAEQADRASALARRARGPSGEGPLKAPALLIEGRSALGLGRPEEAVGLLQAVLDGPKPDAETLGAARYYLGLALQGAGAIDRAMETLGTLAESDDSPYAADAAYLVGQHRFDQGDHAGAIAALGRYLDARPDGDVADHALARLALAHDALGQADGAASALDRLATAFPESPLLGPTRLRIAEAALAAGQADRAEALFRAAAEVAPDDSSQPTRAHSGLGWALLGAGRLDEAAEAFGKVVEEAPDDPVAAEASYARGRALRDLGRPDEALSAFAWVVEHAPESEYAPKSALARARLLADAGTPAEAVPLYQGLIDQGGGGTGESADRLLAELGWTLLDAGRAEEADRAFVRLLEEHPDSPLAGDARINLAESAFRAGDFERVVSVLDPIAAEGAEAEPRLLQAALYRMGRARAERREWAEAAGMFERLAAGHPDGPYAREAAFWAAEVAFRGGDAEAAEAKFAALVDATPSEGGPEAWLATARLRRIQALEQLGRWTDVLALADAMKAELPGFPQMAELDFARGRALQGQAPPRFDEARDAYQAVIDARKGGELAAMAQFMRGETFFHQKRYDEALREFLKVVVLPSYNDARKWQALALLEAGKVYEQLDRWADAADLYERLRSGFPDEPASEEADRRLAAARRRADGEAVGSGSSTDRRG